MNEKRPKTNFMDAINVLIIEDTVAESDALVAVLNARKYNVVGVAQT